MNKEVKEEPQKHWVRDGLIGLGGGILFGATSVITGHPFDVIKTQMQAGNGVAYERSSTFSAYTHTLRTGGVRALYRGFVPPLIGSGAFRSIQFGAKDAVASLLKSHGLLTFALPLSLGTEARIPAAAVVGGLARAVIETPLEYVKIKRQLGLRWEWRDLFRPDPASSRTSSMGVFSGFSSLYKGFGLTFARSAGTLVVFFSLVDTVEKLRTRDFFTTTTTTSSTTTSSSTTTVFNQKGKSDSGDINDSSDESNDKDGKDSEDGGDNSKVKVSPIAHFVTGSLCATAAWWTIWPLEVLKSNVQGNDHGSIFEAAKDVVRRRGGIRGLYRGIGAGTARSIIANGSAFMVMSKAHELADDLGLRGD